MNRGGFLRSLLAAPAVAVAHVSQAAEGAPEGRQEVLALSTDPHAAARIRIDNPPGTPSTALRWSYDAEGNWYIENTASGRVTRL